MLIGDWLSRVFHKAYFAIFTVAFIYILAQVEGVLILLPLSVGILFLCIWGYERLEKIQFTDVRINRITVLVLGIMAILMAVMGWMMIPNLRTDMGMVYYSAMEIIQDGKISDVSNIHNEITTITNMTNNEYFVVYPNNLPILFFITSFYRLVTAMGISMETDLGIYMGVLLNLAVILFSVWLGSRIAGKIWGNKVSLCFLAICALFVPYYINVSRFYTDTLTLPFPLLAVYFYLRIKETSDGKHRILLLLGLGSCLAVGFLLKGSCVIMAVALLIHCLLGVLNRKKLWRRALVSILLTSLCFGVLYGGWNFYVRHCSWVDMSREEELTFPAAHWVMMALSGSGGYHPDDFDYTYSFGTKEEKKEADIKRAVEKIQSHGGPLGFLHFELMKIGSTWSDGKYAQQVHLTWCKKDTVIQEFTWTDGKYHAFFYMYITTFILVMYLLFFVSMIKGMFQKHRTESLFSLCIFGVLLFFAFWETKSRYLLNFTPIFFLCMIDGLRRARLLHSAFKKKKTVNPTS